MKYTTRILAVALFATLVLPACKKQEAPADKPQPEVVEAPDTTSPLALARTNAKPFAALPADWAKDGQTKEQEDLGRMLFYDTRMSKNHDISCNSCHKLDNFGVDGEPTSPGHKAERGSRNSPTVLNAAGHFKQFWDGRAADVEEQAKGPVLNPVEMAMADEKTVVAVLKSVPDYEGLFKKAFPDAEEALTYDNMAAAIGAFERKLSTRSKWDDFLDGDDKALTEAQLHGFNAFVDNGCVACHTGALVGGSSFQKLGAAKPWPNQKDVGRHDVTKAETDKMLFKAPSLRNIAKTGPYFHDGSVTDLTKAVQMMGEHQLAKTISDEDAKLIVGWLETLTGTVDREYVAVPELPKSGPRTPKPDPT